MWYDFECVCVCGRSWLKAKTGQGHSSRGGDDSKPVQLLRSPVNCVANLCLCKTTINHLHIRGSVHASCCTIHPVPSPTQVYDLVFAIFFLSYEQDSRSHRPEWATHSSIQE